MIAKQHTGGCARCDQLGREAERAAAQYGKDTWLSIDGVSHSALYTTDTKEEA